MRLSTKIARTPPQKQLAALGELWEALGELWEALGQLWEALAELWEALGELWEGLDELWVSFLAGKKAPAGMSHRKPMLRKRRCHFWLKKKPLRA